MYKLFFTITLGLFLLIPFGLRLFYKEPFPAVILPSGHGKRRLDSNTLKNIEYECFAYYNRKRFKITLNKLLQPIPNHYYSYILKKNLGATALKNKTSKKSNKRYYFDDFHLKKWYLKNIGLEIDSLKVFYNQNTRLLNDETTSSSKILSIKTFYFNDSVTFKYQ
ncbi:hypothetical protein BC781_1011090 [Sediminitomix flava]|uniref:Uncharacterized protein n=1 Tax=Sediminitomix flava TaxID=379075 RepID=A0A315ZHN9_SEDFL|nr:hypothetical protein BC781_1011090 [Sediminitomix flava]